MPALQLALFDLDHTLLDGDSDGLWFEFLAERGAIDIGYMKAQRARHTRDYRAGRLDVTAYYNLTLQPLADYPLEQLHAWRDIFMRERIRPHVTAASRELLQQHREAGHTLAIVTATNRFVTELIADELGVPNLLATEAEFESGRYTGRLAGTPCFREGKLVHLKSWLQKQQLAPAETWFYSDSHNDLPLLEHVDHPVAVDPDPVLSQVAAERTWPVVSLRRNTRTASG